MTKVYRRAREGAARMAGRAPIDSLLHVIPVHDVSGRMSLCCLPVWRSPALTGSVGWQKGSGSSFPRLRVGSIFSGLTCFKSVTVFYYMICRILARVCEYMRVLVRARQ